MIASETWVAVVGFENYYEVSSHGKIKGCEREVKHSSGNTRIVPSRIVKGWKTRAGYTMISLWKEGIETQAFAHRLVCEAFHGPKPSADHEVAHGDGDPTNSCANNVRWATHAENIADKRTHGTQTFGESHSVAKLTLSQAIQIKTSTEKQSDLARRFKVTPATICDIKKGRSWSQAFTEAAA